MICKQTLVSVVIPCYNQAHFLGEAIESVLSQTYQHFEIIVVDDGSTDSTSEVAARYPKVHLIRQENQGLAAARNTALHHSEGDYLMFLDADDRLLPEAFEVSLECFNTHPECAFVSGHYKEISVDGSPLATRKQPCPEKEHYVEILRANYIITPAVVMYQRIVFDSVGGFNTSSNVRGAEDFDLCLRIAREFPVCCHGKMVAEYRRHGTSMSQNSALMLKATINACRSQRRHTKGNRQYKEAIEEGVRVGQDYYGGRLVSEVRTYVRERNWKRAVRGLLVLLRYYPRGLTFLSKRRRLAQKLQAREQQLQELKSSLAKERQKVRRLRNRIKRLTSQTQDSRPQLQDAQGSKQYEHGPPVGQVSLGDLRRLAPISRKFGYDRGKPIDRYYIENFLARQADDIRGRVLEIKDDSYTRKYGGDRVEVSDVLDMDEDNRQATVVADLTSADHVPSNTFDCIIFTQTLQLIYNMRPAIQTLHRILKPDGILLATFPGISQISYEECGDYWCWAFTQLSVRRLFAESFPEENLRVEANGNVLAAIAFLHGLASKELHQEELDYRDPDYEVLITLRAVKPGATP